MRSAANALRLQAPAAAAGLLFSFSSYFFIFFFFPQRAEMSRDAINKKKIVTFVFCLIGGRTERGFRQGSQALERSTGGSWAARGRRGPPSARPRGAASAARGAAELGASAGQGPP